MTAATLFDLAAPAAGLPGDDERCPICDMKPCGCPTFRTRRHELALIVRTLRAGHVLCVLDADQPRRTPLAWAMNGPDGWQVTAAGRVVGDRLTQRRALALMERAGRALAYTPTTAIPEGTR